MTINNRFHWYQNAMNLIYILYKLKGVCIMININENTVAVETSAELKNVLEASNDITYIYLANDITLEQGITILGTKVQVTIDGLYPADETGEIHTYTDMNSAGSGDAIGVRTASNIHVKVKNLNVVGKNYYGLIYVSETSAHKDVIITYENITYNGPQITYHPSGLSIYQDMNINIVASTASPANEVGEVGSIQMGGKVVITHNATGDSTFWFRGTTGTPYIEILQDADVSITTTRDIAYTSNYLKITVNKNAKFNVKSKYGFFRDNGHQASSILVDENSVFSIIQRQANGTVATLNCRGDFEVNSGATIYLEANYQNSAPLILFNTTSSKFNINNPKSLILYNKSYNCLGFGNTSTFNINCGKLDYWATSPELIETGNIGNTPLYAWYKSGTENLSMISSVTSSKTTITSTNLTDEEKTKLPDLTLLTFQTAKTIRIMEFGTLELLSAPSKIEFQRPIIKENPLILGRKNDEITILVSDSRVISSEWYLYAYIEKPLTSSNQKYTLKDSLIFVSESGKIKTLSDTPTLVYTGSSSGGTSKTTDIKWNKTDGILFQVIDALYNGETYTTPINWILTEEKIES